MRQFLYVGNVVVGVCACVAFLGVAASSGYLGDSYSEWSYIVVPVLMVPLVIVQVVVSSGVMAMAGPAIRARSAFLAPALSASGSAIFLLATWLGRLLHPHGSGC
jgi:hypothetical protein